LWEIGYKEWVFTQQKKAGGKVITREKKVLCVLWGRAGKLQRENRKSWVRNWRRGNRRLLPNMIIGGRWGWKKKTFNERTKKKKTEGGKEMESVTTKERIEYQRGVKRQENMGSEKRGERKTTRNFEMLLTGPNKNYAWPRREKNKKKRKGGLL